MTSSEMSSYQGRMDDIAALRAGLDQAEAALRAIREITSETHRERPYTALSEIDQIARRGLAG